MKTKTSWVCTFIVVFCAMVVLTGCAYRYNENLSPSENAYYQQLHIENIQRAGAAMTDWSFRQQELDIQRTRGSGRRSTCRVDMFGTERCRYN